MEESIELLLKKRIDLMRYTITDVDGTLTMILSNSLFCKITLLMGRALGDRFRPILINSNMMRKGEAEEIREFAKQFNIPILEESVSEILLHRLQKLEDWDKKEKVFIEEMFQNCFLKHFGTISREELFVAQEYLFYTSAQDIFKDDEETGSHSVNLLADFTFDQVIEIAQFYGIENPLRYLDHIPFHHLLFRIVGEVTPNRVLLLQEANAIALQVLYDAGIHAYWMHQGVILAPMPKGSASRPGNESCKDPCEIILRFIDWEQTESKYPSPTITFNMYWEIQEKILAALPDISRVVLDLSNPNVTSIEWQ